MCMDLTRRHFLYALGAVALAGCSRSTTRNGVEYRVAPGDTLSTVSQRSGVPIAAIVASNDLRSRHLTPGQKLWLPGITSMPQAESGPARSLLPAAALNLVSRHEWGAQPLRENHDPMGRVTKITVHHTSEIPGMMERHDVDLVRAIQRYHQDHRHWADIGYHFLIGRKGEVYEGRPVQAQGAHVGGAKNRHNLGVSVIGDFQRNRPTSAQLASLETLLAQQQQRYRIPTHRVIGHRELAVTVCPGDNLFNWLTTWRGRA